MIEEIPTNHVLLTEIFLSTTFSCQGNLALREVMEMCIKFHKNILVDRDGIIQLRLQPATTKKRALPSSSSSSSSSSSTSSSSSLSPQRAQLMSDAAANLLLASYRNHVLHLFVNVAMVMLSVRSKLGRVSEVIAGEVILIDLLSSIHVIIAITRWNCLSKMSLWLNNCKKKNSPL